MLKDILRKNDDSFILINGVTFERAKVLEVIFEVVGERTIEEYRCGQNDTEQSGRWKLKLTGHASRSTDARRLSIMTDLLSMLRESLNGSSPHTIPHPYG